MNTMELDARRGILARESFTNMVFTKAKVDSKEYILNSIKEGYQEMQEIKWLIFKK